MSASPCRCIAVDDDPVSLGIIEVLVERTEMLQWVKGFEDPVAAANYLRNEQPDILFLDVEMPEMTGIELLQTLRTPLQVILTTSKKSYALEAFEYEVTDYLLKPLQYPRFLKAVEKAVTRMLKPEQPKTRSLFVKEDHLLVSLPFEDIAWVEAYGDYVKIYTTGRMYTIYTTLKTVESRLPASEFLRVHRSFIVRLDRIENIDAGNLQIADKIIPVSNTYRPALMARIQTL